jgi:hypothetical protein
MKIKFDLKDPRNHFMFIATSLVTPAAVHHYYILVNVGYMWRHIFYSYEITVGREGSRSLGLVNCSLVTD